MKTIETVLNVNEQGLATIQMPPDVVPGTHRVVVVIEETKQKQRPLDYSSHEIGTWPFGPEETFRREDMYGDDGR